MRHLIFKFSILSKKLIFFFTFNIKYPTDVSTGATLDLLIGVIKLHMQLIRQMFTNSTLTCPHGAYEKYIAFFCHFIRQIVKISLPAPGGTQGVISLTSETGRGIMQQRNNDSNSPSCQPGKKRG